MAGAEDEPSVTIFYVDLQPDPSASVILAPVGPSGQSLILQRDGIGAGGNDDGVSGVPGFIDQAIDDHGFPPIASRYFNEEDSQPICAVCSRIGHTSRGCSICMTCGLVDPDHSSRNCPVSLTCFKCGGRGHRKADCTSIASSRSFACSNCRSTAHRDINCPTIWRNYTLLKRPYSSDRCPRLSCFNCAGTDHFGDECPRPVHRRSRMPSAFTSVGDGYSRPRHRSRSPQRLTFDTVPGRSHSDRQSSRRARRSPAVQGQPSLLARISHKAASESGRQPWSTGERHNRAGSPSIPAVQQRGRYSGPYF